MKSVCDICGGIVYGEVDTTKGDTVCQCRVSVIKDLLIPPKPYVLTEYDRIFLRKAKIDPDN